MKRLMTVLLLAVVAAFAPAVQNATAKEAKTKKASSAKELRWHGTVVRINTEKSTIDVSKGTMTKTIYFDSSTVWTNMAKPIEMSEVKEGAEVIVLGVANDKKEFVATRVDVRAKKML